MLIDEKLKVADLLRPGTGLRLTRRSLLDLGIASIAAVSGACGREQKTQSMVMVEKCKAAVAAKGRFLARPQTVTDTAPAGLHPLKLDAGRDGLLYVPVGYSATHPAPLVLMLHGAGSNAQHALAPLKDLADASRLILLAPDSRGQTWDIILDGYGPDIAFIDRALAQTLARYAVDPVHIAAEGFSDGASYALSVGITNGDLFTHVMAFSPGFITPPWQRGKPRLFISHGMQDSVLPINVCSRRIVPQVRRSGYDVRYQEFDGDHGVPPEIARQAVDWFIMAPG